jgi:hypothetical protein
MHVLSKTNKTMKQLRHDIRCLYGLGAPNKIVLKFTYLMIGYSHYRLCSDSYYRLLPIKAGFERQQPALYIFTTDLCIEDNTEVFEDCD